MGRVLVVRADPARTAGGTDHRSGTLSQQGSKAPEVVAITVSGPHMILVI